MITKCRFCDYQKSTPLSIPILEIMVEEDLPMEDWLLWCRRMVETVGIKDYNSVKIHMGIKHKKDVYKYMSPDAEFEPFELVIINKAGHSSRV